MADVSHFYADTNAPICPLVIKSHFDNLSPAQKRYAYHISRASWLGGRIILKQTTPRSSDLFDLVRATYSASKEEPTRLVDLDALRDKSGVTEDEFTGVLEYGAQVLNNLANYKSFGDSKFIPRVPASVFAKVVAASPRAAEAVPLFDSLQEEIYATTPAPRTLLGYPDKGHVTGLYTTDVTEGEIKAVQAFLEENGPDPFNTRLFKRSDGVLELRVASSEITAPPARHDLPNGLVVEVVYGDFADPLAEIANELEAAIDFAENETQKAMLRHYVKHFRGGDVNEHKESQKEWIKDIGPVVETNIGFVETYRDPAGTRAEWEGFTAVVNKEMTKKFERLVKAAPEFIPKLPWGTAHGFDGGLEKDKFLKPDFTALEILTFATGGVPAGINIPNWDDVRQIYGFKNVSLSNVLNAKAPNEKITFLSEEDAKLFSALRGPSFEVQVGIHELLGHGTGKILQEEKKGSFNFDKEHPPVNPLTGKPIEHWYGPGETWGSRFGSISSSYEECRAESVAMYLSVDKDMLAIFGHTDTTAETADDILYIGWLNMCRAGLLGLEFYDPAAKKWGQAHMQARYAITRVLLDAGEGLVSIEKYGEDDLRVTLDRSKIASVGVPAMAHFLTELQVHKATGDVAAGKALYDRVTSVPDDWLEFRKIVIKKRLPRKLLLQANTSLNGDEVVLTEYEATLGGFVQSYLERSI